MLTGVDTSEPLGFESENAGGGFGVPSLLLPLHLHLDYSSGRPIHCYFALELLKLLPLWQLLQHPTSTVILHSNLFFRTDAALLLK